jgi:hypothetical protein
MAQHTVIQLTDDLDGKPIKNGDGETVAFTYRGQSYELDLSNKNLETLDNVLQKYMDAARKTSGPSGGRRGSGSSSPRKTSSSSGDVDPRAVRAWAEANGVAVSPRGRIKAEVLEQYKAANQ